MACIREQGDTINYIDSLPEEMLVEVLSRVPGRDLISRCRLVCRSWNSISTSICRRRRCKLNLSHSGLREAPLLNKVSSVFKNLDQLPWSSCHLRARGYDKLNTKRLSYLHNGSFQRQQLQQFVAIYGTHIKELKIGGDNEHFPFELLPTMSKLEVLDVTATLNFVLWHGVTSVYSATEPKPKILSKLSRLSCNITDSSSVKFLAILLGEFGVKLNRVDLTYPGPAYGEQNTDVYDGSVLTLIANTPNISVNFSGTRPYTTQLFSDHANKAQGVLDFSFKLSVQGPTILHSAPFESFLAKNTRQVRELEISCGGNQNQKFTNSLRIPSLQCLKSIKLYDCRTQYDSAFDFILPFVSNQFPMLEAVKIHTTIAASDHGLQLFKLYHFPTIKVLDIFDSTRHTFVKTEWYRIFPNLQSLKFNGRNIL